MTKLYFAYGSNMSGAQMHVRCPGAEFVSVATLCDHHFLINQRGVATLRREADAETPGVLWRITEEHEAALDRFEGYAAGIYDKCQREVTVAEGATVRALVYIDHNNQQFGAPREGYMERVVAGASEYGLPDEHIRMLLAWPTAGFELTFIRRLKYLQVSTGGLSSEVVRILKREQDQLLLSAVDGLARAKASNEVFEIFLDMALMDRQYDLGIELDLDDVEQASQRLADLKRLKGHIEVVLRENKLHEVLREPPPLAELSCEDIIFTSDPERLHLAESRFIVTRHAPLLAALWKRATDLDGVASEAWACFPYFADAVEPHLHEEDILGAVEQGLREVQEEVDARIREVLSPEIGLDSY